MSEEASSSSVSEELLLLEVSPDSSVGEELREGAVRLLLWRLPFGNPVRLLGNIRELSLVVRLKRLGLVGSSLVVWTLLLLLQHNVDVRSAVRSSFRRRNVSST
jgi:hypothetical protein